MAKDQVASVKDAVHKVQLALLEGIGDQNQLFAAGALMSKGDYQDVVTERTIGHMCGYPVCGNSLPSERPWKGRYRISLKEHKVYDLQETYMYCSTNCVINSRTFAASLQAERCSVFNTSRINEILSLFKSQSFDLLKEETMGTVGDLGLSKLKIQEKTETITGEVSLEDWIGPSNAIEGYVPKREQNGNPSHSKANIKGSESTDAELNVADGVATKDRHFESVKKSLTTKNDESFELLPSKTTKCLPSQTKNKSSVITVDKQGGSGNPLQNREANGNLQSNRSKQGNKPKRSNQKKEDINFFNMDFTSTIITQDEYTVSKLPSGSSKNDGDQNFGGPNGKAIQKNAGARNLTAHKSSTPTQIDPKRNIIDSETMQEHATLGDKISVAKSNVFSDRSHEEGLEGSTRVSSMVEPRKTGTGSSLKSTTVKKSGRRVTWADDNEIGSDGRDLCEFKELSDTEESSGTLSSLEAGEEDSSRLASAKAVSIALSKAAEAVASGQTDVSDAVTEAGILVLPQPGPTESKPNVEVDGVESIQAPLKCSKISEISSTDVFDSNDSWFDLPPEGFSLTLSPFATMWNTLFTWMTCSSLAYIYGKDDNLCEEYLFANGREYPRKIFLPDGRSSEIKQTTAGCLSRALLDVIAVLKLKTPVSTLEKGLGSLLETMSFMEALPSFRFKQWQVIDLLFLEALSIHRIPEIAPHMAANRGFFTKILDGAQMSIDEYEFLKEIVLPYPSV